VPPIIIKMNQKDPLILLVATIFIVLLAPTTTSQIAQGPTSEFVYELQIIEEDKYIELSMEQIGPDTVRFTLFPKTLFKDIPPT